MVGVSKEDECRYESEWLMRRKRINENPAGIHNSPVTIAKPRLQRVFARAFSDFDGNAKASKASPASMRRPRGAARISGLA